MNIHHQAEQQRFVIELKASDTESDRAVLEYSLLPDNAVNFSRTYVPFRHRGQGHAEVLVKHGLAWARQQGLTIQASCWYVRDQL